MKYSKNIKLNTVLNRIAASLIEMGLDEVKRYIKDFEKESDHNIAQHGNLLCYHCDIYELYRSCGYKTTDNFSTNKIWETYKRQVGYVARQLTK